MPETHRLSYVGDPSLISAFLRLLNEEGVCGEWDNPPIERREGSDLARHEPYSILARGQHDVATAGIERAITRFRHRFPGQADIHDDGQMPDTHRLNYLGDPSRIEALIHLLQDEDLSVDEPDGDDDWPSVSEQLADNAEGAPITIRATGWNDISIGIRSAFAKFQDRFPGQAAIRDEDETP